MKPLLFLLLIVGCTSSNLTFTTTYQRQADTTAYRIEHSPKRGSFRLVHPVAEGEAWAACMTYAEAVNRRNQMIRAALAKLREDDWQTVPEVK